MNLQDNLIWIDLEMTGLDTQLDSILELAVIVTDAQLNELAVGPVIAVNHDVSVLSAMDEWNTRHHTDSGLWQRVLESQTGMAEAEAALLAFLPAWTAPGASPMCGNSICQDRRFMHRLMPNLEAWFHYRNLDVSTVKELAARWAPEISAGLVKQNRHEALSDIRESIDELKYYRQFMGSLSGLPD